MCFTVELSRNYTEMSLRRRGSELLNSMTLSCPLIKFLGTKFVLNSYCACGLCSLSTLLFWCRCGWGKHPFPSRTRRLRPNRPMVLHWRRCGRAGGRQIKKEKAGLAWWNRCWFYQWFKKKRYFLFKWLIKHQSALYLENCIHEIWLS